MGIHHRLVLNGSAEVAASAGDLGPLPHLLLIGTRKGGTTFLSELLLQHAHILKPRCIEQQAITPRRVRQISCVWEKEVRFFSRALNAGADLCWYRRLYPCVSEGAPHLGFDGSPDYFVMDNDKIAVMAATLPTTAKLVATLRNPADRFYSAYNMGMSEQLSNRIAFANGPLVPARRESAFGRRRGQLLLARELQELRQSRSTAGLEESGNHERLKSSLKGNRTGASYAILAASLDRWISCAPTCPEELGIVSMFFNYGMYAYHLRRYFNYFGRERILILKSEDLYRSPLEAVRQVVAFAGLASLRQHEARVLQENSEGKRNSGSLWGGSSYSGKLAIAERSKLLAFYKPHNRDLYQLVGRDFGWEAE